MVERLVGGWLRWNFQLRNGGVAVNRYVAGWMVRLVANSLAVVGCRGAWKYGLL